MSRPDLFVHTVNNLLYGQTASELSEALYECIERSQETGKQAKLTLSLTIKPTTREGLQYEIKDEIKTVMPQLDRGITLMFKTEDGNLQRENPAQQTMELKSVEDDKPSTFKTAENQ
jgi:hypothetical protein